MLTYEVRTHTRCDTTSGYGSHGSDPEQARQRVLSFQRVSSALTASEIHVTAVSFWHIRESTRHFAKHRLCALLFRRIS